MEEHMRKVFVCAAISASLISGYALAQEPEAIVVARPDVPSFVGYVPGQIVVQFKQISGKSALVSPVTGKTEIGVASLDRLGDRFRVTKIEPLFRGARPRTLGGRSFDLSRYHRITFGEGLALDDVMAAYRSDPNVESVEPIGIHTVCATPNDGNYTGQWHLSQTNDKDVDAPEAWDFETGDSSIIVAVLDTGVRYFHKDLGGSDASYANPAGAYGNMWINWVEKNGTADVDDDGNGYVDDWVGYDFVVSQNGCWSGEDCSTEDNDPRDFNGHGTHCAGNVAAINNNGYATCSVAGGWLSGTQQPAGNGVKVMACRIGWSGRSQGLEAGYVRMDYAAEGFYYAADNGAKIASCSWGSSNTGGIAAALDYFIANGGLIFKAAGNDGTETADYMCGREDIIAVAASDSNDCKADFSTYGTWVEVSAPGTGILSSYHYHPDPENDYIAWIDGTSMATPITASVAALIWSKNPGWTAVQVKNELLATTDPIDGLACNSSYTGKLGTGRVNAYNAVAPPPDVTPPEVTVVRPNGGELFYVAHEDTVRWIASDNASVDSVSIYYSTDGGSTFPNVVATGEPNDSSYVWLVPDTPSANCIIKIVAYDSSENSSEDVSDAVFSIEAPVAVEPTPGAVVFGLSQNYPNPFNPLTRIEFSLAARARVSLSVYDTSGKLVRTLVDETLDTGKHSASWNGEDSSGRPMASGVYVFRLVSGGKAAVCKSVLLR
jgi:subtilisin family serine protease